MRVLLLCVVSLVTFSDVTRHAEACIVKYGTRANEASEAAAPHTPWDYAYAGADWNVGTDASGRPWICGSGLRQSPVNLLITDGTPAIPSGVRTRISLGRLPSSGSNIHVINTGHSIQVEANSWSGLSGTPNISIAVPVNASGLVSSLELSAHDRYQLVNAQVQQLHFHSHSEHMWAGVVYPLEGHIVLRVSNSSLPACPPTGCLSVIGVPFRLADGTGDDEDGSDFFDAFSDVLPVTELDNSYIPAGRTLALDKLLPPSLSYAAYSGSLTTPPCTEEVLWHVMLQPRAVTLAQLQLFLTAFGDEDCTDSTSSGAVSNCTKLGAGQNYRLPQPLHGRVVKVYNNGPSDNQSITSDPARGLAIAALTVTCLGAAALAAGVAVHAFRRRQKYRSLSKAPSDEGDANEMSARIV